MIILPNGVAVIEGDTHHADWCRNGLVHDKWFADILCRHLQPGDLVIEGGANIGTLTRPMLEKGARVLAFEPNEQAVDCLRHNCQGFQLEIFEVALGEDFSYARFQRSQNAGASFCTPADDGEVMVWALDKLTIPSVKLIKLDIEGFEAKALRGARELIMRCRPVIVCEVNSPGLERAGDSEDALLELLEGLGYSWSILQHQCKRGSEMYDIECLPS